MDKNLYFVASWFGATLTTILFSSFFLYFTTKPKVVSYNTSDFSLFAALPSNSSQISQKIGFSDARSKIIENFFKGYKSTLAQFSSVFIEVADKYSLDFRLLPAIAMQESNGGKKVIKDSYNPFGFGIYGTKVIKFSSWEEGIEKVGKTLRYNYIDQGLKTPKQIMSKYTPPSAQKDGAWAKGVALFISELR